MQKKYSFKEFLDLKENNIQAVELLWQGMGIHAFVSENKGIITLSKILVPKESRDQGFGTKAMQILVDYADETGQTIVLTPSADFGGNKNRLVDFYKRFGFVQNKGRSKDFGITQTMYRLPVNFKLK